MSNRDDRVKLSKALKQHFAGQQLSGQQLARLQRLQQSTEEASDPVAPGDRSRQRVGHYRWPLSAVAAAMLAIVLSVWFYRPGPAVERVVAEIAYNHNQAIAVEVESGSIPVLDRQLSRLEFALIASARLPESEWQLLGGRYCMINGRLAAQIKVRQLSKDRIYTLYQASLPKGLSNLNATEQLADGVRVRLWREQGLLLGLAGDA